MKKIILILTILCFQSSLSAMSNQDLNQQFLQYVKAENYPLVLDSLYNNLVDINVTDSEGRTALILAVILHNEEMVKTLLPFKPDRLIKDNSGKTALEHAINLRHLNIIKLLKASSFQEEEKEKNEDLNQRFLQYVKNENYQQVLDLLYNKLIDINVTDSEGRTALILAVLGEDKKMVKTLLPFKPNLLIKDKTGKTALEYAVNLGNTHIINLLEKESGIRKSSSKEEEKEKYEARNKPKSKASPAAEQKNYDPSSNQRFLQYVMDENHRKVLDLLYNNLIDINVTDSEGKTALILAVLGEDEEMVKILLSFKADRQIKDKTGKTALEYAVNLGNTDIINLLGQENVKYRPEYRKPSEEEEKEKNEEILNSKFLDFVSNSKYREVDDLLKKGLVDVNGILYYETFKRRKYTTALNAAINGSDIKMVEILLNYGAYPYIEDSYNNDAFHYINQSGKYKVLEELLKKYGYKARTKQPKEQPKVTVKPKKVRKPILYISKEEAMKKLTIKDPSWVTLTDNLINKYSQLAGILDRDYKKTLKEDQEVFEQGRGIALSIAKIKISLTSSGKPELINIAQEKFDEMNILNKIKNFMDDSGKKFIDKIFNDINNAEKVADKIPGAKEELRIVQSWKSGELQESIKPYMDYIDGLALFTILREAFGMQGLK